MRAFFDTETSGLPDWKAPSDSPNQPFGKDLEGAHGALADVRACREVFRAIRKGGAS